ncbi:MFS transporter [Streptomyces mirabilis]|nr:MFS transporter [Streptomyces mirabilis]MCT9113255.1 MFS transporter [Streptomyces mirabilis]
MLGGTLPIPLYALWAPRMGFGPFTTTLVFAVYALGTVLALMVFASLSDRAGRRPFLAAAVLAAATSTALFLLADDVGTLLAARFLCGLGTGVFTATATAALGELAGAEHTRRVSTVSTAANMGGLGLGSIVAGLFAQYGANPTHLVFWAYLASLVPAFLAVIVTPETVTPGERPAMSVRRPTIPDGRAARTEFLRAATAVLAAFAVSGLFSSLVPSFLREELHVHNVAAVGAEAAVHRRPDRAGGRPGAVDRRAPAGVGIPRSGRRGVRGRAVDTVTADVRCRNASGGYRHRPGLPPRCRGRPAARRHATQGGSALHVLPVRLHRHDRPRWPWDSSTRPSTRTSPP